MTQPENTCACGEEVPAYFKTPADQDAWEAEHEGHEPEEIKPDILEEPVTVDHVPSDFGSWCRRCFRLLDGSPCPDDAPDDAQQVQP